MQITDKPPRAETHEPHRNPPSFSSSLLDEIYNSIDGKPAPLKVFDEMPLRKQRTKSRSMAEEDIHPVPPRAAASRRRLSLMSEMEKIAFQERDFLFFSSTNSSSSDATLSSLDDHRKSKTDEEQGHTIKPRSTAHKIYAGLKKVKQSGKIKSFIVSIFKSSKSKKMEGNKGVQVREPLAVESKPKQTRRFDRASSTVDRVAPPNNGSDEAAKRIFKSRSDLFVFRDEDGNFSDSSSDLFELDHSTLFGNKRVCDEVPVCESSVY